MKHWKTNKSETKHQRRYLFASANAGHCCICIYATAGNSKLLLLLVSGVSNLCWTVQVEVVYQRWHWGATPLLCHLQYPLQVLYCTVLFCTVLYCTILYALQTVFVVISSLSISAIAVDRCIVICCTSIHNWSTRYMGVLGWDTCNHS